MIEETEDPTTWITERNGDQIFYENTDGRSWWISGTCIACGECESFPHDYVQGMTINQVNVRRLSDGTDEEYIRVLTWNSEPGVAGACTEQGYQDRKDVPMTPDAVGSGACTLSGGWIF